MKQTPYWLDSVEPFRNGAAGPLEGRADVAVIGGGFTGLSAAMALAQRGAKVVLLEAERVVGGASGRNGGHCNNGLSHDFGGAAARLGLERARALYHAFDAAVDTVERIAGEEQIACDFRRCGKIKLAAKPAHYETLARSFELLHREADPDTALVPASKIRDEVDSAAFHGGLLYRKSAQLHVGRFGVGLAQAAHRRGAAIFENARVTAIRRLGGTRHRISSARGEIEAAQVLLATGASPQAPWFFRRRLIPVGSFVIATAPLTAAQLDRVMPTRRNATTTKHIGNYFRVSPDNRLIFGGRARFAASNPRSDRKSGRILEATLHEIFPQLSDLPIEYCWGGSVDMSADRYPRAGERGGIHYAAAYSGHGVQMSVHMGQMMAAVMDGHPEANPFRELDWPAVPGHFGRPWFLPLVGLYYRFKDLRS
ncbi:MAG: FAD-binding oxidoreductase [Acidisphaera sp.]|nr:FAD-binding oxidoreductase [Acidisphaera sp.]